MVPYYGDFAVGATVYLPFNTFSSDDPSASVTITNLVNTDVHVHKNGGTTQRNNAAGVTMSVDYDSITGNHLITLDTSDNTVADFWVAAGEYQVRVEGTTIDGATVNAWVGAFSIERSGGALALLKNATYGLSAIESLVDDIGVAGAGLTAVPWNAAWDAEVQSECTDALNAYDPPTNAEMELRTLAAADYVVVTDTIAAVTTVTNLTNAPTSGDFTATMKSSITTAVPTAANVADAVWDEASTGHTDAGKAGAQVWTDIDAILADTGTDGVVLAADAIAATKIADDAFSSEHFATGAFTADAFAADAIVAATLATGCLTADAFAADALVAATFATDCITDDAIATGAIASTAFAAGAITNAAVADDVDVNVKTITANAITATSIADNAIDLATFAADCKTGSALKANVETITNNAITAAAIATDAIDDDAIAANVTALIADAVWNAATGSYGTAGTYGESVEAILEDTGTTLDNFIDTEVASILSDLEIVKRAIVYKKILTFDGDDEGNLELFNAAGVSLGTITDAFTEDATTKIQAALVAPA